MQPFQVSLAGIDKLFEQYKNKRPLSKEQQEARYEKLRLEWTYNSNAIEGNSLTLGETAFYLREGLTSEGKPLIDYLEPLQVPGEMEKLVRTITEQEEKTHPVELASFVHYEITRIHPFDDCNGRIARILLNLILMKAGYPPIVIKMEERRRYLESLEKADKGDKEPFYLFVAEHVKQSLKDESISMYV